jgi:hypothetical protein
MGAARTTVTNARNTMMVRTPMTCIEGLGTGVRMILWQTIVEMSPYKYAVQPALHAHD